MTVSKPEPKQGYWVVEINRYPESRIIESRSFTRKEDADAFYEEAKDNA